MTDLVDQGESSTVPEHQLTYGERVEKLQERARAGDDVTDEAASLLFQLQAFQSQRIEHGMPIRPEDFAIEVKMRDELEALALGL